MNILAIRASLNSKSRYENSAVALCARGAFADPWFLQGFFSGTYNGISGKIRDPDGDTVYTISGKWSEEIILTRHKVVQLYKLSQSWKTFPDAPLQCESVTLFNVATTPIRPKIVELEEEQEEYESRRLWHKVTTGLLTRNIDAATDEKTKIEDNQRVLTKARVERNEEWIPRFFKYDSANDVWVLNQTCVFCLFCG